MRGGRWNERGGVTVGDLEGATLGIVGFGRIGRKVAQIAEAFDLRVRAYDPFADVPADTGAPVWTNFWRQVTSSPCTCR